MSMMKMLNFEDMVQEPEQNMDQQNALTQMFTAPKKQGIMFEDPMGKNMSSDFMTQQLVQWKMKQNQASEQIQDKAVEENEALELELSHARPY